MPRPPDMNQCNILEPDDAIYPMCMYDADGNWMVGENKYVVHFNKEELPPVNAFWSLTMYDEQEF